MFQALKSSFSGLFAKFWVIKLKPFFWEGKGNPLKQFKSKVCHTDHFRKWFLRYPDVENKCSECFCKLFDKFLSEELENIFEESKAKL